MTNNVLDIKPTMLAGRATSTTGVLDEMLIYNQPGMTYNEPEKSYNGIYASNEVVEMSINIIDIKPTGSAIL